MSYVNVLSLRILFFASQRAVEWRRTVEWLLQHTHRHHTPCIGNKFVSFCRFFRCRCCCCCWGCASSILHWRSSPRIVARANIVSKMCAASTKCVYCSSSIRFHSLLCRFCVFRYEGVQTFIAWTNSNNNITSATTTKTMTAATTLTNPKEWKKKTRNET